MSDIKHDIDDAIKTLTKNATDSLTKQLIANSPDPVDEKELKKEISSFLDIKVEEKRINSAFDSIVDYLHRHGSPVELEEIRENWREAFEKFTTLLAEERAFTEKDMEISLQEAIGISQKTFDQFYKTGRELYSHKEYQKAADIFFTLALFNQYYYNVWLSLGLSEQHCGHFDAALRAYAMAAITNIDSPEPFLHGADCCIAMHDKHEAELYLEEAVERIDKDRNQYESLRPHAVRMKQLIK